MDVLRAQGSILTNKYAEGYPGKRYYNGCEFVDKIETLAIERVKELFNCKYANVQPHAGSQANQAVFLALMNPGDTFVGLDLSCGGHLTHGSRVNLSGKWFKAVGYGVDAVTQQMDYDNIRDLVLEHTPKILIAGGSAYPRIIDFERMRSIADEVGAYLMVDMAHFAGLVAGGMYPSPLPHAHVVTSTTHKTLRGPRGAIILTNEEAVFKKINSAVFPGLQGGPLVHAIAARAIAFREAMTQEYKDYTVNVVKNAKIMGETLVSRGIKLVSGGTDTHFVLADLTDTTVTGHATSVALEEANITCNKNGIPYDPTGPMVTSGIRLGSPACTTRGFKEAEFITLSNWIADIIYSIRDNTVESDTFKALQAEIKDKATNLCKQFPIYRDNV